MTLSATLDSLLWVSTCYSIRGSSDPDCSEAAFPIHMVWCPPNGSRYAKYRWSAPVATNLNKTRGSIGKVQILKSKKQLEPKKRSLREQLHLPYYETHSFTGFCNFWTGRSPCPRPSGSLVPNGKQSTIRKKTSRSSLRLWKTSLNRMGVASLVAIVYSIHSSSSSSEAESSGQRHLLFAANGAASINKSIINSVVYDYDNPLHPVNS